MEEMTHEQSGKPEGILSLDSLTWKDDLIRGYGFGKGAVGEVDQASPQHISVSPDEDPTCDVDDLIWRDFGCIFGQHSNVDPRAS